MKTIGRRRILCWALVMIAVVVTVGDVCVLPLHVHASAATGTAQGDRHQGGPAAADHSLHSASCEALGTASVGLTPAVTSTALVVPDIHVGSRSAAVDSSPDLAAASPPLFLLHAALLI